MSAESTRAPAALALAMTITGVSFLAIGAALKIVYVVAFGYVVLMFAIVRARALLRRIDAGDLPADGRPYASFAWMIGMAGSGLAVLAFASTLF